MDLKTSLIDLQCEMVAERALVNPKEITWLQYDILYQLNKEEEILPSDLSIILGVSRTKLSKAMKELKYMGYVEQFPNKLDGRELLTSISNEGKILLESISKKHSSLYEMALKTFTVEEQKEFSYLSDKLSTCLRKARIKKDE